MYMKKMLLNLIAVAIVAGSAGLSEAKNAKVPKVQRGTYQELLDKYEALENKFEKLEEQREQALKKNPSQDEMAAIDYRIASVRKNADDIYDKLEQMPQFSTFQGKLIPASPRYNATEKYDEKGKECMVELKKANKEVETLSKELKTGKK